MDVTDAVDDCRWQVDGKLSSWGGRLGRELGLCKVGGWQAAQHRPRAEEIWWGGEWGPVGDVMCRAVIGRAHGWARVGGLRRKGAELVTGVSSHGPECRSSLTGEFCSSGGARICSFGESHLALSRYVVCLNHDSSSIGRLVNKKWLDSPLCGGRAINQSDQSYLVLLSRYTSSSSSSLPLFILYLQWSRNHRLPTLHISYSHPVL
nr:hypothetical protein CFP56_33533 [Quercus suber]